MKLSHLLIAPAVAAVILAQSSCTRSEAQTAPVAKESPGFPQTGVLCSVKIYREGQDEVKPGELQASQLDVNGTLVVVNDQWICVKEGSSEHWIPRARVLDLRLSR